MIYFNSSIRLIIWENGCFVVDDFTEMYATSVRDVRRYNQKGGNFECFFSISSDTVCGPHFHFIFLVVTALPPNCIHLIKMKCVV